MDDRVLVDDREMEQAKKSVLHSFVLGIVSCSLLAATMLIGGGLIFSIAGLVCGLFGRKAAKSAKLVHYSSGKLTAGSVMSLIGMIVGLVLTVLFVGSLAMAFWLVGNVDSIYPGLETFHPGSDIVNQLGGATIILRMPF